MQVVTATSSMIDRQHPYADRRVAQTHVWLTPPAILQALGPFDLDPCAAPSPRPWPTAARHIELPEDGLAAEWSGRVWLNPPYGQHAGAWIKRMANHDCGTALLFARTETRMFVEHVWTRATALLFLAGRPHFHRPDGTMAPGNSGGPLVLIAYGAYDAARLAGSGLRGSFIELRQTPTGVPMQ